MIFKIIFFIIIFIIGFGILSLIVFNKDVEQKRKNREKFAYIKFSSQTIFNEKIDSSLFSTKKITLVNIWATYCSACIDELQDLQEIFTELKTDDIGVLGIVSDLKINSYKEKDLKKAVAVIQENQVSYPNIFADDLFVEYATGKLFVTPTTVFVDHQGNVIGEVIESALSKAEYLEIITKILNNETSFSVENNNLSC
ncbi:MAG: TlpA disulfide reductase family protein [Culicoidibacterales bacterium]